MTSSDV